MESKGKKSAIYCRVAHSDDFAIENQRRRLVQYAEQNRHTGLACYLDNGQNGLSFDRPAFSQMETDIRAGKIRAVIVSDVSRIGRNYLEVDEWISRVQAAGVDFVTTDYPYNNGLSEIYDILRQVCLKKT